MVDGSIFAKEKASQKGTFPIVRDQAAIYSVLKLL